MCDCAECGKEFDCGKEGPGTDCVTFMACSLHENMGKD